nr:Uncharacterised protein [Klebsiella pneumoniae]
MEKDHKTKANEFKGDYNERKSKVKTLPELTRLLS